MVPPKSVTFGTSATDTDSDTKVEVIKDFNKINILVISFIDLGKRCQTILVLFKKYIVK